jgi:hypothetical protein
MTSNPQLRPEGHPDPIVTANIYCSGRLDDVMLRAMVPFRRGLRALTAPQIPYLWLIRYSRGGEHLKVRVHGPQEIEPAVKELLARTVEGCLAAIGPRPQEEARRVRRESIPIDDEDRSPEDPPDRSLLLTHYGISQVSLGGEPFLSQERYRALMTLCLARGCDQVLDTLEGQQEILSHGQRQRTLLKALLSGLAALRFPPEKAEAYLAYHRDWLIRFPLLREGGDEQKAADHLALLERQAEKAAATVSSLRSAVQRSWTGTGASPEGGPPWGQALAGLHEYVSRFRDDPDYRLDPFTNDQTFTPIFKAFHGLGNQLGLRMLDEAYAHHLLLMATAKDPSRYRRLSLSPD